MLNGETIAEKPKRDRRAQYRAYYLANHSEKLEKAREYRENNREKRMASLKEWKKKNPQKTREYVRVSAIKNRYGITREQHQALYEKQQHRCAICGVHENELKRRLSIDHDHETGKVRGLVCQPCNLIIGYAEDSIDRLKTAIAYLEKSDGI